MQGLGATSLPQTDSTVKAGTGIAKFVKPVASKLCEQVGAVPGDMIFFMYGTFPDVGKYLDYLRTRLARMLELIPEKNCRWEKNPEGKVCLLVPRFKNRVFKKIALQLGRSEWVKISFDEIGSKSWDLMDGRRNVEQIGELLEKELGEQVKPVYQRLTEFVVILSRNKFIIFKNYS